MATFILLSIIVILGILIGVKPIHQKFSKKPIIGVVVFLVMEIFVCYLWRGIWQLWPIYFILGILTVEYLFLTLSKNKKLQVTVKFNIKLYLVCAYISVCGLTLFPVIKSVSAFETGQPVGTWKMAVESADRVEPMAQVEGVKRRFTLQLYYPVNSTEGKRKKWLEGGAASVEGLALSYGLPEILIGHLKSTESGAYLSRKIAKADHAYQVIVISHGFKSSSDQYTRLAETLAARGYFVVVANHPYSSYATVYNQKDFILGARSATAQIDMIDEKIELERKITLVQQGDLIETFKVLDRLNQGVIDERFKGLLDLTDLTLVGHQIGGGAVLVTLEQTPYVKTGVLLNPILEQIPKKYILNGSSKAVLALVSNDYMASNNAVYLDRFLNASKEQHLFSSNQGKDLDMTDVGLVSHLFKLKKLSDGKDANRRMIQAQIELIDQAVQKYSQGQIFEEISENLDHKALGITLLNTHEYK